MKPYRLMGAALSAGIALASSAALAKSQGYQPLKSGEPVCNGKYEFSRGTDDVKRVDRLYSLAEGSKKEILSIEGAFHGKIRSSDRWINLEHALDGTYLRDQVLPGITLNYDQNSEPSYICEVRITTDDKKEPVNKNPDGSPNLLLIPRSAPKNKLDDGLKTI